MNDRSLAKSPSEGSSVSADYDRIMNMSTPFEGALAVVRTLQEAGYIAYFAGGWVRDFLMQHPSDDIDIATDAPTNIVQKLFDRTIPVGIAFGIVIVVQGEHHFEVATFRTDVGTLDGRRPLEVLPARAQEDAKRRDFTINGMFFDPLSESLYDYVFGQRDIEAKVIRAIGNPHERFAEDRLRMIRAVRYATRFGFAIEPATLSAIRVHAQELLPAVAIERIWQECKKMSHFASFDKALILLHDLGLLQTIFPQLRELSTEEMRDRAERIERLPKEAPTLVQLLELFPHHPPDEIDLLSQYLKLPRKEMAFARFYRHLQRLLDMPAQWLERLEPFEWATLYADSHCPISLAMIAALHKDPKGFWQEHLERQERLRIGIDRIRRKDPLLRAAHLMNEGLDPGEILGKLLKEGERLSVNLDIDDPVHLIALLKKTPLWPR